MADQKDKEKKDDTPSTSGYMDDAFKAITDAASTAQLLLGAKKKPDFTTTTSGVRG